MSLPFRQDILFSLCGLSPSFVAPVAPAVPQTATAITANVQLAANDAVVQAQAQVATADVAAVTLAAYDVTVFVAGSWPLTLPLAARQTAHWGDNGGTDFAALMRAAAAGDVLTDPVTGARLLKVTSSATHGGGDGGNEYGGGGGKNSLPWGSPDTETWAYNQAGSKYCDVDTVNLTIANRRANPGANASLAFAFSRNTATPQDMFWVNQGPAVIKRRNTAGTTDITVKSLTALAPGPFHQWMDVSADERHFVFQSDGTGYVIHWDATLDVATKVVLAQLQAVIPTIASINEIHLVKEGGYALVSCNPPPRVVLWNLLTQTLSDVSSHASAWTHGDSVGGYHILMPQTGRTFDPSIPVATNRYSATETVENLAFHITGQWRQTGALGARYWGVSHSDNGRLQQWNSLPWALHSGVIGTNAIYRVTPSYFAGTGQSSARLASGGMVRQYVGDGVTNDRTLFRTRLTKVASLAALTAAGQWFHDDAGVSGPSNALYVRPLDELDLTTPLKNMIGVTCPSALPDCLGLVKVADGVPKDVRMWAHHYSHFDPTIAGGAYYPQPRAALGQNGRSWGFTTNMGKAGGRTDYWIAFPPVGA